MINTNIGFVLLSIFFVSTIVVLVDGAENVTVRYCYECNSILHPGCADGFEGDNKFPHEKVLKYNYSRACSDSNLLPHTKKDDPPPRAVGCRKILQEVDGKTRIVRQCAYTKPEDSDEVNGMKRTGNQGVRLFYYQCARDYCNSATKSVGLVILTIILPVIFAFVVRL